MRLTIKNLKQKYSQGEKVVCLAVYDAFFASLADEYVDVLLVGDSLGMTILGYDSTIQVTLDNIIYHTQAVVRGSKKAFVVSDMPFMSNHISIEKTCENASRLMQESFAQAVKLEGGMEIASVVKKLVQGGIPVMGHLGILPQKYYVDGGYFVKGEDQKDKLLEDALALQKSGAFAIVLEGIKEKVARYLTKQLNIPTIGIGASRYCDGQIQVMHDLLGMSSYQPKHSKRYRSIGDECKQAFKDYTNEVKSGDFPTQENIF